VKKVITLALAGFMLFTFSGSAFAANAVSQMATTKGGRYVAECAKTMDKGVSQCAKTPECTDINME